MGRRVWTGRRVLFVGGGASGLPAAAVREFPVFTMDVLERNAVVLEAAREHLETGLSGDSDRIRLITGNLDDRLTELTPGSYDLVIVDSMSLAPVGGPGGLSQAAWTALFGLVHTTGALALGPEGSLGPVPNGWTTSTLRRTLDRPVDGLDVAWPKEQAVLVAFPSATLSWLSLIDEFSLQVEVAQTATVLPPPTDT